MDDFLKKQIEEMRRFTAEFERLLAELAKPRAAKRPALDEDCLTKLTNDAANRERRRRLHAKCSDRLIELLLRTTESAIDNPPDSCVKSTLTNESPRGSLYNLSMDDVAQLVNDTGLCLPLATRLLKVIVESGASQMEIGTALDIVNRLRHHLSGISSVSEDLAQAWRERPER